MLHRLVAAALLLGSLVPLALVASSETASSAPAGPQHQLSVSGNGVGMYPAFDPTVQRYAVTTTSATAGSLTVQASSSDASGVVRVNGRVAPNGTAQLSGLKTGDEISVFIEDSSGTAVHSLVYLPAAFPALERTTPPSSAVAPGQIGVNIFDYFGGPQAAATLDRNGVPTHVETIPGGMDLKQQPDGTISMSKPTSTQGRTGMAVVVMNNRWQETARYETVGLKDTDSHDSILLPDGSRWLMSYETRATTDRVKPIDSIIQKVSAQGVVLFQWSSAGLEADSVIPFPDTQTCPVSCTWDYAHINSFFLTPDGDIVASFRHFSSVLRIDTSVLGGAVEWKLGGRDSDFDFVNDPFDGPCAQHTASLLPNGHVMIFDDGSDRYLSGRLCLDQSDPTGAPQERMLPGAPPDRWQSRVAEYALDTTAHTATLVWDYTPPGIYTWFMGSAARLSNGNTLIGWSAAAANALASEVSPAGALLWQLRLAPTGQTHPRAQWSYRASLMNVPDVIEPVVDAALVPSGATYVLGQRVPVDFGCTDLGGSSLQSCGGDVRPGGVLDTSTPGQHTLRLSATDGAGNTTTVTRSYTVTASYQPRWTDDEVSKSLKGKRVSAKLKVVNGGNFADTFTVRGDDGNARFDVHYKLGRTDVTGAVRRGTLSTGLLKPGQSFVLRIVVARTDRTRADTSRTFKLLATSVAAPDRVARTRVVVEA